MKATKSHIKNGEKNLEMDRWVIFHPYANFNRPYLKIGPCNLLPLFSEQVAYSF